MLERRVDLSQNLHKAIAPVEIAENRLDALTRKLRKELDNLNAVSDLAAERISHLETSFQEQVSNLFTATADAEARSVSIRDVIARERSELDTLSNDLVDRLQQLEGRIEGMTKSLDTARSAAEKSAANAEKSALTGGQHLFAAGHSLEKTMTTWKKRLSDETASVNDTVLSVEKRIHSLSGTMDNAISGFSSSIDTMNDKTGAITSNLVDQAGKLTVIAEKASSHSEQIEKTLHKSL